MQGFRCVAVTGGSTIGRNCPHLLDVSRVHHNVRRVRLQFPVLRSFPDPVDQCLRFPVFDRIQLYTKSQAYVLEVDCIHQNPSGARTHVNQSAAPAKSTVPSQ